MSQPSTEFLKLIEDLEEVLFGKNIDDVVPALTGLLSEALYMSEQDKKKCVSYVVNIIDRNFAKLKEMEERNKQ